MSCASEREGREEEGGRQRRVLGTAAVAESVGSMMALCLYAPPQSRVARRRVPPPQEDDDAGGERGGEDARVERVEGLAGAQLLAGVALRDLLTVCHGRAKWRERASADEAAQLSGPGSRILALALVQSAVLGIALQSYQSTQEVGR